MKALGKLPGIVATISALTVLFLASPLLAQTGSLTLAWDANTESDLLGYRLYYKSQGSGAPYDGQGADQGASPIVMEASSSPQITLTGLDPNSDYEFAVTAFNSSGESDYSAPVRILSINNEAGANGSVDPDGPVWVESGENKTITITPEPGYLIANVMVNGASQGMIPSYTFTNVTTNQSLNATFSIDTTDTDGDGLCDYEETSTYGTDPNLADSDDDGISDGDELAYWGNGWNDDIDGDMLCNLLDADADGDGYWDGEELANFSDPGDDTIMPNTTELALEFGEIEIDHNWHQVSLTGTYTDPVVIANGASYNGSNPATIRIRNVSPTDFEIRIEEWDYLDESHTIETVGYLVMEAGVHYLDDGTNEGIMAIAGYFDTDQTISFDQLTFPEQFEVAPIVVTAVTTNNGGDTLTVRQKNVSQSGFKYKLQEQESRGAHHVVETIGYVAWEPTSGTIGNGLNYEVGRTPNAIRHSFTGVEFGQNYTTAPVLIAAMQTTDGGDTAAIRWRDKDDQGFELMVEEEESEDTETYHTTEEIGYMVFSAN